MIAALAAIRNPRLENDILSAGMIRDLTVTAGERSASPSCSAPDDPATWCARLARRAGSRRRAPRGDPHRRGQSRRSRQGHPRPSAGALPGDTPGTHPSPSSPTSARSSRSRPARAGWASPPSPPTRRGARPGRVPRRAHGRRRLRAQYPPDVRGLRPPGGRGGTDPAARGVRCPLMSLGLLVERDAPAIWRGPIIMKVVQQFLRDVEWGQLDYLIVDLPPGTGDAQLSLVQATQVAGAIIVTTPQEVAVGDALRGAKMFERVGVPVFGIVENMSGFVDPELGPSVRPLRLGRGRTPRRGAGRSVAGQHSAPAGAGGAGRRAANRFSMRSPRARPRWRSAPYPRSCGARPRAGAWRCPSCAGEPPPHHPPHRLRDRGLLRRRDEGRASSVPRPQATLVDLTHAVPPGDLRCRGLPAGPDLAPVSRGHGAPRGGGPRRRHHARRAGVRRRRPLVRGAGQRALHSRAQGRGGRDRDPAYSADGGADLPRPGSLRARGGGARLGDAAGDAGEPFLGIPHRLAYTGAALRGQIGRRRGGVRGPVRQPGHQPHARAGAGLRGRSRSRGSTSARSGGPSATCPPAGSSPTSAPAGRSRSRCATAPPRGGWGWGWGRIRVRLG